MVNKSIYFLHIPKTSGTSVTSFLDQLFTKDKIFPYQRWDLAFQDKTPLELTKILNTNSYKFYRGHFGYHRKFVKNKFVFTMLRDPINRTISQYKHIIKFPRGNGWVNNGYLKTPSESLKSVLKDPKRASIITNVQARYLSSPYNPKHDPSIDDKYLYDKNEAFINYTINHPIFSLFRSIFRLLRMDFFGLQEFHEESMLMLADKLNIRVPLISEHKLSSFSQSIADQLDTETQNLLVHTNNLDNKLYFISRKIFEHRMLKFINHRLNTKLNIYYYLTNRDKYLNSLEKIILK